MGTCNVTCVSDWVRWLLRTGVAALGGTGLFGRHAQRAHVGGIFRFYFLLFLMNTKREDVQFVDLSLVRIYDVDGWNITCLDLFRTGGNLYLNILEAVFDICKAFRRQNLHIVSTADSLHSTVIVGRQGPVKTYSSVNLL